MQRRSLIFTVILCSVLILTPLYNITEVTAIGGRHGGLSNVDAILNSNFTIWTFGGHASAENVQNIHALAEVGIKVMHIEGWWSDIVSNPIDIYYNDTFKVFAKESINSSLYGILPSYEGGPAQFAHPIDPNDIWAITLGDEEPAWLRYSDVYTTISPEIAKYNDTYYSETGHSLKPIYEMNTTESWTFIEWLNEKTVWVYNYMHDYVKSQVPHALVFQYMMMPPIWGKADSLCAPYELKADGHAMDCFYARDNPWLMHEGVRLYKTSLPDKPLHWDIWGTIWDFLNEAGDGYYFKEGSYEQIRQETWISYVSGVDVLGYFTWAPQNNDSYTWHWGHERTDIMGLRLWRYVDNLAGQLANLPVMKPEPEVLVVGCGVSPAVFRAGLFTEYDMVNQRCFVTTDIDLSQYSLILVTDDWYLNDAVIKLNEYVVNGGNLAFLGGISDIDGPEASVGFSLEDGMTESFHSGQVSVNITEPNLLGLQLEYEAPFHQTYALPVENLTLDHHQIGNFSFYDEFGNPAHFEDSPLLLYHNSSQIESGWILYFGALHSSTIPGSTWKTYDSDNEVDLWYLFREVTRAFGRFLNITNSISTVDTEDTLITQALVEDTTLMAGIINFQNVYREIPYVLDLSPFDLPDGNYWVHSLDEDTPLGQFESDNQVLNLTLDVVANGTRLLLISEEQPIPDYYVDIFPHIPSIEDVKTTTDISILDIYGPYILVAGVTIAVATILILKQRKRPLYSS